MDHLLSARSMVDNLCLKNLGHRLYRFPGRVEDLVYYLSRQVSWDGRHRGALVNLFEVLVNQGLDVRFMESSLSRVSDSNETESPRNPLKVFGQWLEQVLNENESVRVSEPFHLLNDLRDLAMELLPEDEESKINRKINKALGQDDRDLESQFYGVLARVTESYDEISNSLKLFAREEVKTI